MKADTHYYEIGGWPVAITFCESYKDKVDDLLPSYAQFEIQSLEEKPLLSMYVEDSLEIECDDYITSIGIFKSENGNVIVDRRKSGGFQIQILNVKGVKCALLQTSYDFSECHCCMYGTESERLQGIKSALMISYAFAGSLHDTLMFHASAVMHEGSGYMFIAPSGTGKSTHSQNWIRMIPGTKLLNDDTPIVRLTNRQVRIYGSPWSGKTPCYRNICVPLKGVARIERATENRIIKKEGVDAFASLLIACAIMKREKTAESDEPPPSSR